MKIISISIDLPISNLILLVLIKKIKNFQKGINNSESLIFFIKL